MSTPPPVRPASAVLGPDDGELLPAGPVVHRILEDGSTTGGRLGMVEARMPAGWPGPPQHVHRAHDETFFVLAGAVRFSSADTETVVGTGGVFVAGTGTPHTFGNADPDEPARLLLSVTPQRYVDYFRELAQLPAGVNGLLDPEQVRALMSRYATVPWPVRSSGA